VRRRSFVLAFALLAGGCAARAQLQEAAPPAKAAEEPEGRKPLTELDALEHDLAVSEQRLEAQLVRRQQALSDSRSREGESDASKKTESAEPPPAEERADEDERPRPRDETPEPSTPPSPAQTPARSGRVGSPCDMACRALSSMRRSADRICELAGASDERCARARNRVSAAEERIRQAHCECVGGGSEDLNARL
jgi:hypothetical protein